MATPRIMVKYLTYSFSIAVISWIIGLTITALLSKTSFYNQKLAGLNFVASERVNGILGLKLFKWIILHSFFKYFNPKLSIKKRILLSELGAYRSEMTKAEVGHLIAFVFMAIFIVIKIVNGLYIFALVMLMVNIIMNLYPSLLQQQNKRRIDRYFLIMSKRSLAGTIP